jgi:hypothetical protein
LNDLEKPPFLQVSSELNPVPLTRTSASLWQPTRFIPGKVFKVFKILLASAAANVTWILSNRKANYFGRSVEVSAAFGTRCTGNEDGLNFEDGSTAGSSSTPATQQPGNVDQDSVSEPVCQCVSCVIVCLFFLLCG